MRNTVLLILITAFQVFAEDSYSQDARLSLDMNNVTVANVLEEIENQSEFYFLFNAKLIDIERKVTISTQEQKISDILGSLFSKTGVDYLVYGKQIILSPNNMMRQNQTLLQQNMVSGRVTDNNGSPLAGVTILVKGTATGSITDADGKYMITLPPDAQMLVFSFVGMKSQEIEIAGKQKIDVVMEEDIMVLGEVVTIGYGRVNKRDLTGAVATVDGGNIANVRSTQLSQALQGSMPGVMVTRNGSLPGASATIRIRGITTIGENDPLVIVDGIPVSSIDDVNPNDIENMTILKDAASASIYGARAAAGVILITTKRAKTGQLNFEYDGSYGFENLAEFPEVVGAKRYLEMTNELYWNDAGNPAGGEFPLYTEDEVNNWLEYNKTDPNNYPVTNWRDILLYDNAPRQRHMLAVTYGGDKISSRASINYENTEALFYYREYEKITTRLNNEIRINKFLTTNVDFSYVHGFDKDPNHNPLNALIRYAPIYSAFYEDGRLSGGKDGSNMWGIMHYGGFDHTWSDKINGKISLEFKPIENLTLTGVISPYFSFSKNKVFTKQIPYYAADDPTQFEGYLEGHEATSLKEGRVDEKTFTKQFLANYTATIGGAHHLNLLAGYEDFSFFRESLGASSKNYILSGFPYLDLGPLDYMTANGDAIESAYQSFFGRIMYDYKNRYLLQANIRRDGSSRFHPDYRWANFPSVSVGWVITEESFMQNVPVLSFLKLRGSWGNLGNERIGYYPYQSTIGYSNVLFYQGTNVVATTTAAQVEYAIQDVSWETTTTWDIGLDAYFLNNRLMLTADYYDKKTRDMLLELEIPDYMGFENPNQNTGIMYTKGWEVQLGWNDKIGDLKYSASFNLSDFKSTMGDLGGIVFMGDQIIREGSEYMEWYGYKSDGLFQTPEEVAESPLLHPALKPGDVKYLDIDGPEGIPDEELNPTYDKTLLGGSLPRFLYGGNISMSYKNFDFFAVFQGVGKQNSRIIPEMVRTHYSWWTVPPKIVDGNYWSHYNTEEENLHAKYPRVSYIGAENNNYEMSDYWLFNGAYFRLKNITFGYTIPQNWANKIQLNNLRIYASITDLFSVDNYPKGWDPEATISSYISKTFNFGLNIKF